jgi:predicted dehydrogenase/threonine dehydrogenase-like Zn-dependent dehydrogenase
MKQVLIRQGRVVVEEMPVPDCGAGEVLVRTAFSVLSPGTETASVRASTPEPAVSRWTRRARKVGEVVRMLRSRGPSETRASIAARIEGPSAVSGYSLAGTVLRVGPDVADLVPGQRVACAGASSAHHAEIVAVPRNLVVPVPERLPLEQAAFVTLGAIALQGVRQAEARLGELVCVIGLGPIGQLSAALLRASGCRVVGADLDASRAERARDLGVELAVDSSREDLAAAVDHASSGRGADAVLLTAHSVSSAPIRQAVDLVRRRGRIVVVGAVGMDIDRGPFYEKDAELRISCSYGPGRYDPTYEEEGRDYPYEYVRWTENRNMAAVLALAAEGRLPLEGLADRRFPVEEAAAAYAELTTADGQDRPLGVVLEYPGAIVGTEPPAERRVEMIRRTKPGSGLGVALVGPGSFASEVHLPNLARLAPSVSLRAVVGRTANSAREAARKFAAAYAATDLDEVLRDDGVDLVLICTRHDLHAAEARRALEAGKAVFLEKPAALRSSELDELATAVVDSGRPFTVGFNRRFAPAVLALRELLEGRSGPVALQYRVNAGKLPRDHWALGPRGGGRLIGEACHMIDLLGHLVGAERTGHALQTLVPPTGRDDLPLGDNFVLSCRYADGSIASLTYTSLGAAGAGKERIEGSWDGKTAVIEDFRTLAVHGVRGANRTWERIDKGHAALLARFVEHAAGRAPEPVPWPELLDASRFVLELDAEARGGG